MIYKNKELNCTETELQNFINTINVEYEIRDFSEPYNGVVLENPTGQENAKYYILKINNSELYQPSIPGVGGNAAITEENALEVIEKQKTEIIDNMIFSQFAITEEEKQAKEIEELKAAMAELGMLIASNTTI